MKRIFCADRVLSLVMAILRPGLVRAGGEHGHLCGRGGHPGAVGVQRDRLGPRRKGNKRNTPRGFP